MEANWFAFVEPIKCQQYVHMTCSVHELHLKMHFDTNVDTTTEGNLLCQQRM